MRGEDADFIGDGHLEYNEYYGYNAAELLEVEDSWTDQEDEGF